MAITLPTLEEMTSLLVRDYKNRLPEDDVSRTTDNWKRLRTLALGITSLHRHLQQIDRDMMPDKAARDRLDRWGAIYGVPRLPATPARGTDALRVTGTPGAAIALGLTLTDSAGLRYATNEGTTVGPDGYSDVDVIGVDTGAATRLSTGATLTFTSPPAGINSAASLVADMNVDGQDAETDGKYRVRILEKIAQPEMGGNAQDFRSWARQYEGAFRVDEAYVWPLRNGLGSVHLAALKAGSGSGRLLSAAEIAELQAYIDELRPVGYEDFKVITVTADPQDVHLTIVPLEDAAYAPDWDDSVGLMVDDWVDSVRALRFDAPRPADMAVGDRLIYHRPGANNGAEYVIEAFDSTDGVILAAKPVQGVSELGSALTWPTIGNQIYSGGPLIAPARQKILDFMNAMGPARPDSAQANTDFSEGGSYWEGTLRRAKLASLASSVPGVNDTTVITPAANYAPANESPLASVGLVVPRQVLVRYVPA
jgi:uncharacterized phage protein gp47/JayE